MGMLGNAMQAVGNFFSSPQPNIDPTGATPPDIPVSGLEATLAWLAHGGDLTPGQAANSVRADKVNALTNQLALQRNMQAYQLARQQLSDRDFIDWNANPGKFAENDSANLAPQKAGPDDTIIYRGGAGNKGGYQYSGPGTTSVSPTGVVSNTMRGVLGTVGLPQVVAGRLKEFTPDVSTLAATPPPAWAGTGQPGSALAAALGMPQIPQIGQAQPAAAPAAVTPAATPQPVAAQGAPTFDQFHQAVLAQESGNRPGVIGPQTRYGVAQGIGQVLPQTGQAMAAKLGIPWRPDLMTATTPEGQAYQTQISRAYAQEAWQASGGDPAQAARYYYGGPNQRMWGPKTQQYAQNIVARLGGGQAPQLQGGAGGDQIQPGPTTAGGMTTFQGGVKDLGGSTVGPIPLDDPRYKTMPPGTILQGKPDGTIEAMPGTGFGQEQAIALKGQASNETPIKSYQSGAEAYGALVRSAALPNGGMRAYALRDTFARVINPGAVTRAQVIESLQHAQGIPANVKAYFMNLKGDGDVPPEIAQQILDAAHAFVSSQYAGAQAVNDRYGQIAGRINAQSPNARQLDPRDITADIGDAPHRMQLGPLPPKAQLVPGQIYVTRHGPALWSGTGFSRLKGP